MKKLFIALILTFCIWTPTSLGIGDDVKSGLIYYICKNIEWPSAKQSEIWSFQ